MSAALFECQKAVVSALKETGLCENRIYDEAPDGVAFPYIEIGDGQIIPDDTSATLLAGGSDDGVSEFFDVHVWGRDYAGKKQVTDIIEGIHGRLHGAALAIVGRVSALAWVRTMRILTDPDGRSRHGVVSVEIVHRS